MAKPVAQQARITTRRYHRTGDAVCPEDLNAALDNIPLRNATQVDTNTGLCEPDRTRFVIEFNETVVNLLQLARNGVAIRPFALTEVVMLATLS